MTASFHQSNSRMVLLGDGQRKESWLDSARRWLFRLLKSLSSLSEAGLTGTDRGKCSAEIFQQCPNAEGLLRGRQSKEDLQLRLPFGHSLLVGMNVRRGGPPLRPSVRPSLRLSAAGIQMLQTSFSPPPPSLSPSLISHSRCMTRWRSKWRGRKSRTTQ